ncbi:MAG: glycosyltransferase family 39 protein [Pseudomonadota bacterium]
MRKSWLPLLLLACFAALPALSLLGHPGAYLAGPHSELPVKLWGFAIYHGRSLLGGAVGTVGFPGASTVNNPDPLGTVFFQLLSPLLGAPAAYNLLVVTQLWAAMAAAWLLARELTQDRWAALTAGVGFGLTPLLLVYPVLGSVGEVLNLWPYPLALLFGLRALRSGRGRDGLWAGVFGGLGFVTCPYDFVVFEALLLPLLLWLPLSWRAGLLPGAEGPAPLRAVPRVLGAVLLGGVLAAGWYVLWMKLLMASPEAQVSEALVVGTRHTPPYRLLHPTELKRYTAFLGEYLAWGKPALVARDMVSRFYRAFSPGLLLMALAILGVVAARGRRRAASFWAGAALFAALASTGPFLPWSAQLSFDHAVNPAWLGVFHLLPGGRMLLEPLRYGLVAALCLAVGASLGVAALARRWGAWVALLAPALVVAEVAFVSPVPVPLPVAQLEVSPAYARLDEVLPPGAIVELPWFDHGSQRFQRQHFLNQLVHGRPIPDEVVGFPPRYLVVNQFTAQLIHVEKPYGELVVRVERPDLIPADMVRLAADGFTGIVFDPAGYDSPARAAAVLDLLAPLGTPIQLEDRLVFALASPDMVPDEAND